jgi:murein DD-endopeptidase MepM/ murein hydrolase activator NlpD
MVKGRKKRLQELKRKFQILIGLGMIMVCLVLLIQAVASFQAQRKKVLLPGIPGLAESVRDSLARVPPAARLTIIDTLQRNESLQQSMRENSLPYPEVFRLTEAFNQKFNLRYSYPGHWYLVTFDTIQQTIRHFEYTYSRTGVWEGERIWDGFVFQKKQFYLDQVITYLEGTITASLWQAMADQGINQELIFKFTDIFDWDIDFLTETQKGDNFRLVFEEFWQDGKFIRYGRVLVAEYRGTGGDHIAVFYHDLSGHEDYYDLKGNSMRKLFTKSPLNYKRISSKFTRRRYHPILKKYRPHLGIDFAAQVGTPVRTVGDGTVLVAGWDKKGYGNYVKIRHPQGYVTMYGHLKKLARGVSKGKQVVQNQLIGWVGKSGRATGAHLDYRVKRYGKFINPLRMKLPVAKAVPQRYIEGYQRHRDTMLAVLKAFPLS